MGPGVHKTLISTHPENRGFLASFASKARIVGAIAGEEALELPLGANQPLGHTCHEGGTVDPKL